MANFAYPVSSIIGGVSNLEYAIRIDSQSTEQSNCLLSGKYGLCKRPSSEYITKLKSHTGSDTFFAGTARAPANKILMHTLTYGTDERILIGMRGQGPDVSALFKDSPVPDGESWVLVDPTTGGLNVINHFPSSGTVGKSAIRSYEDLNGSVYLDPAKVSFATMGDRTYINFDGVSPAMGRATWTGYNETYNSTLGSPASKRTILNDEVFAIWCKAHQAGKQSYNVSVAVSGRDPDGAGALTAGDAWTSTLETNNVDSGSVGDYNDVTSVKNDTKVIAGILAFGISEAPHLEATSLAETDFSDSRSDTDAVGDAGTSVITGRVFDDMDPLDNAGSNYKPSQIISVSAEGGRGQSNIKTCWKTVSGTSELPPRSWIDHTVKIEDKESDGGDPFYMRFVSDELEETDYTQDGTWNTAANRAFGSHTTFGTDSLSVNSTTTKLPRRGHWEEHCGVGVETTIDSTTMPHVLLRRRDGSFIMTEARGAFQVNSADSTASWVAATNTVGLTVDGGFSEDGVADADGDIATGSYISALIPGDTLEFREGSTIPDEIVLDKTYYVKTVTKTATRGYTMTLSETLDGTPLAITDPASGAITGQPLKAYLTTYDYTSWAERSAGDDDTNPLPDLFYRPINRIFTYQNRLGFVTDKEVWFSSTGDPGSIFRRTVRDLLDDGPFGISPTDARGDVIKDVGEIAENLIVFTNEAQHLVRSLDGRFSSKTVEIVTATNSACDFDPTPLAIKNSLFFASSSASHGGLFELTPSRDRTNSFNVTDVSTHVPGYFPAGVSRMVGSSKHDMVFILDNPTRASGYEDYPDMTSNDYGKDQRLVLYTYTDTSEGRLQSAFTTWDFNADKPTGADSLAAMPTGYTIFNMAIAGDTLFLVTGTAALKDTSGGASQYRYEYYLEKINLDLKEDDPLINTTLKANFNQCLLDRRTANTEVTEDFSSGSYTLITLPWKFDASMKDSLEVVTEAGVRYTVANGGLLTVAPTNSSDGYIRVIGADITGVAYWVGFGYTMSSTMGPFAPQIQKTPLRGRNVFVRGARLTYTKANEFNIAVTHGGTTYNDKVSEGTSTGTTSGEMYFAIRQHMPDLSYTISNDLPWNAMFQGILYDMNIQEVLG